MVRSPLMMCRSRSKFCARQGTIVEQAFSKGAVAAVVRKDQLGKYLVNTPLLQVDDTLVALQTLATAVRRLWGKPLIGVTGSTGKTTTKEAIAHVLSSRSRMLKSE